MTRADLLIIVAYTAVDINDVAADEPDEVGEIGCSCSITDVT